MSHVQKFWKEYIIAVFIIVLSGVFMEVDLVGLLQSFTGNMIGISTATTVMNFSYLFLVILGPMLLVAMAGYTFVHDRLESHDHELHHFPHEEHFDKKAKAVHLKQRAKKKAGNELHSEKSSSLSAKLSYPHVMDHIVLKQHVKNKLMQGHTMPEIIETLNEHGWAEEKINHAYNDLKLSSKDAEIMLGSFVTRALIAGNDVNSIRQSLVEKGWETGIVDKVINTVF